METNEILYNLLGVKKEFISPQHDQLIGFQRELSIFSAVISYIPDAEDFAAWIIVDLLIKRPLKIEYFVEKAKEITIMYDNSEKFVKPLIQYSLMLCPVFTYRLYKIGVFDLSRILRFISKYRSNTILSLFQNEIDRELIENGHISVVDYLENQKSDINAKDNHAIFINLIVLLFILLLLMVILLLLSILLITKLI